MAKEEKPVKPKEKWAVGEVPTQTAPVVINTESNEQYDVHLALAKILNKLEELSKALK